MTDNERKQQLSIAYVHAIASQGGYTCQRESVDHDSVDIVIGARGFVNEHAITHSPKIEVQLKATSAPGLKNDHLAFPLPLKNYNDLRLPSCLPRYLFVLHLPPEEGRWLEVLEDGMISRSCAYWISLLDARDRDNKTTVTVKLPLMQRLTVESLRLLIEKAALERTR